MMGIVYLDTETTSINPGQICELSLILEENNRLKLAKNYFFSVESMDEGAAKVHGFSIESLKILSNGETFKDKYKEIFDILANTTLVAHNLPFDEKFLSQELWRCGVSFIPGGRLDTMAYFKPIIKLPARSRRYGPYKSPKLSEVLNYLGINEFEVNKYCKEIFQSDETSFHDSRFDTTAMFVAVNVQRDRLSGGDSWIRRFCS